ncbi:MAG: hypothetical protein MI863_24735 [Desulfobacterales bacterium]|nr:hypothetical protein [Desulfobacterales bacterium]
MSVHLQLNSVYTQSANYLSDKLSTVVTDIQQRQEAAVSQTPAYVVDVKISNGFSAKELEQLKTIHKRSDLTDQPSMPLYPWVAELTPEERRNFLDLGSQSFFLEFYDFIEQGMRLEGEDRSRFLEVGARMGPGASTLDLANAVKGLSGESLTKFLETADRIGQSGEQDAIDNLKNFVNATGASPFLADDLVDTITALEKDGDETNLHNFLAAAADAGKDLDKLIDATQKFKSRDLADFLGAAAAAREGIGHLITMAGDLDGEEQNRFLAFAAELAQDGDTEVENFILAAQDNAMELKDLMGISEKLTGESRGAFLKIAANHDIYDAPPHRLASALETLGSGTTQASDFLLSALNSGAHLDGLINLVEKTGEEIRPAILEFTASLSQADLTNYLGAVEDPETNAFELAETALELDDLHKSHFLYAAAIDSSVSNSLISITRELKGDELEDFLYTAANKAEGLAGFLDAAQESDDRGEFIRMEREALGTEENNAQEYVFLKSIFDDDLFQGLTGRVGNMEQVVENMDDLDAVQMDAFIGVAEKLEIHNGTHRPLPELLSVLGKLEGDDLDAFMEKAGSLNGLDQANFIIYADAVTTEGGDNAGLYRLIELEENFGGVYQTAELFGVLETNKKVCPINCVCSSCLPDRLPSFKNERSLFEEYIKIVRLTSPV